MHKRRNWGAHGAKGGRVLDFLQIIGQSTPSQLKKLPALVYEGTTEYMCPHSLNASYIPVNLSFSMSIKLEIRNLGKYNGLPAVSLETAKTLLIGGAN